MNNREQFKIDSIEELEQAYEMFKDDYWKPDIKEFKRIYTYSNKKFITKVDDMVFLNERRDYYKTIPNPLKNKSMFNQELIQKLRKGEIAVKNDGSLEQLKAVLKEAFPLDSTNCVGIDEVYYLNVSCDKVWASNNYINKEKVSVTDFFNKIHLDLKKYVLREPNHLFEDELSANHPNVEHLTKAGVFEALYKPIYKKEKPKLPEINGYKGELVSKIGGKAVKYGCAYLYLEWFKETENRHILYLPLSSGVVIDAEEMQQIRKYLKYYDHI